MRAWFRPRRFFHSQLPYLSPSLFFATDPSFFSPPPLPSLTRHATIPFPSSLFLLPTLPFAPCLSLISFQIPLLTSIPLPSVPRSIYPPCTSFSPSPSVLTVPFHLYFRFFHNFASIRYVLTGQWVSGKHLPLVSSSILYHPARRICRGVDTLTSKPGPFLFFHFYAFSPHPRPS